MNYREWAKANPQRIKEYHAAQMRKKALEELEAAAAAGLDIVAMVKGTAESKT